MRESDCLHLSAHVTNSGHLRCGQTRGTRSVVLDDVPGPALDREYRSQLEDDVCVQSGRTVNLRLVFGLRRCIHTDLLLPSSHLASRSDERQSPSDTSRHKANRT